MIRKIGKTQYNHASISLDSKMENLYSFARKEQYAVISGGIVHESIRRFTLGKVKNVPVQIFKIPVTDDQYQWVENEITRIVNDKEYCYNLASIITYPFTKGLQMEKSFTCTEFVTYLLSNIGIKLSIPPHKIRPDEIKEELKEYLFFDGNLLDYVKDDKEDSNYFKPFSFHVITSSAHIIYTVSKRIVRKKVHR